MTVNYARSESAWIAKETSEAFEDLVADIPALCKALASLPEFRVWSAENLEDIYKDAQQRKARGIATASPYSGQPIFGSHRVFSGRVIKLTRELNHLGNKAEALGHALKDLAILIASDETGRVLTELDDSKSDSKANGGTKEPSPVAMNSFADSLPVVSRSPAHIGKRLTAKTMAHHCGAMLQDFGRTWAHHQRYANG
jgi:hypothetical protein